MADKGHQGFASMDEERQREVASTGGHASHEKGAAHEFNNQEAADAGRRGNHAHAMSHANRETAETAAGATADEGGAERNANGASGGEGATGHRSRRTRGGTHDQHVTAGKKGGSRIRQLIELGYKYEQEHGIGPGQNERSKLAAKRRATKSGGGDEGEAEA
jgi:general stress protein YciG